MKKKAGEESRSSVTKKRTDKEGGEEAVHSGDDKGGEKVERENEQPG